MKLKCPAAFLCQDHSRIKALEESPIMDTHAAVAAAAAAFPKAVPDFLCLVKAQPNKHDQTLRLPPPPARVLVPTLRAPPAKAFPKEKKQKEGGEQQEKGENVESTKEDEKNKQQKKEAGEALKAEIEEDRASYASTSGFRLAREEEIRAGVEDSGKFRGCRVRPLSDGVYSGRALDLKLLGGPPKYKVPWYSDIPPLGREVYQGLRAGDVMRGAVTFVHTDAGHTESGRWIPGFVSVCFKIRQPPPGAVGIGDCIWINGWCSHNHRGEEGGVAYCEFIWRKTDDASAHLIPAARVEEVG